MTLTPGGPESEVGVDGNVRGKPEESHRPGGGRSKRLRFLIVVAPALVLAACSGSGPQSSLEPQGEIARDIDGLWQLVLLLATIVFVIVMAGFLISMFRFRERKDDTREPRQVHGNTKLEITWTIIPAVILAFLAVPTVQGIFDLRTPPEGPDVLQVHVTGHQWWWEFEYVDMVADDGRTLITANELHIPAETPVNLTMTSADVIHSFWIPPLNGKRDVVPGRITNLTLNADADAVTTDNGFGEGVILGNCAEFCGLAHADMRMRVFVHDGAGFEAWVDQQLQPAAVPEDGAAAAGYETFNQVCTACHQATVMQPDGTVETIGFENLTMARERGSGEEFTFRSSYGPNLTHFGSRTTFAGATYSTPWGGGTLEHMQQWLDNPSSLKPMDPDRNDLATGRILGMPDFGLSVEDIDNLIALLEGWE